MGDMMTFKVPLKSMNKTNNSVQKKPEIMKKAISKLCPINFLNMI
jgi:hypothetical protein